MRVSEAIEHVHAFVEFLTGVNDSALNQSINKESVMKRFEKATAGDSAFHEWFKGLDTDDAGYYPCLNCLVKAF